MTMKKSKNEIKVKITYGNKKITDCLLNAIKARSENIVG
jgi:hypothetical protein